MITRADKGKTTVIVDIGEYNNSTIDFINSNNFKTLNIDPTNKFQKNVKDSFKQCNMFISKKQVKYLTQINRKPPKIKAQIKLHTQGNPIRPVVNNINAPAFKLAKFLTKTLKEYITLKYQYNVVNSTILTQEFKQLKLNNNHRLITFDVKDLYVNIPTTETLNIAKTMLDTQKKKKHNPANTTIT